MLFIYIWIQIVHNTTDTCADLGKTNPVTNNRVLSVIQLYTGKLMKP